ncbi:MAG: cobyrinate a,c-diamide synthase [Desulfobulbaceae bacterium]|nr:cobyrinate a,c-diamide synthase [Desulfobulbaceae bacterium]
MQHQVKSIVVAGLSGGSGKSVVSVALTACLRQSGSSVVPFKKGPDYIDAGWLGQAAGYPCYNLDPYLMTREAILSSFQHHTAGMDYAVIEGNRGLYDGVDVDGGFSTAELAVQLDVPVLLVVNCTKVTRTAAALVLGCMELDKRVEIHGVILNQIATSRQENIVRQAVEKYTGVPVVGIVPRQKKDIFPMRHLGVTPHQESVSAQDAVRELAALAEHHFDIGRIIDLMRPVPAGEGRRKTADRTAGDNRVTIGVIRDRAFQFYYEENLEALRDSGADLVMIDALEADSLPDTLDGLYIGGGFPETSARELAENVRFRESVRAEAEAGLPIYAECGGLIFLGRSIVLDGSEYPLAGVFPVTFGISGKPQAHGYSIFTVDRDNPFYRKGASIKGHEFRYSTILRWEGTDNDLAVRMERGTGFINGHDGLVRNNVFALYTHILAGGTPEWAPGLVKAANRYKTARTDGLSARKG